MIDYNLWIGKRVRKISGKPFKSKQKVNTVAGTCIHDHRPGLAFRFMEDSSQVACETCELVPEEQSVLMPNDVVQYRNL